MPKRPLHDADIPAGDLMDELAALYPSYDDGIRDDDVTVGRVRKRLGLGQAKATHFIDTLVAEGKLVEVHARGGNGRAATVWRRP